MASGTKIRNLARLLDAADVPVWAISPSGCLVYLSAAAAEWLGVDGDELLDRRSVAGASVSDHPLDQIAASLAPPPGFADRGTASLRVHPPTVGDARIEPIEVRFVRVGRKENLTIAIGGVFDDRLIDHELPQAVAVRQRLDRWRRHHGQLATVATAGVSPAARRMRARLQLAASTRTAVGFFGPKGCGAESIAMRIHQLSAPDESLVAVDGPLMDSELLDASMAPLVHQLADSPEARATALIRGLDEMPIEAQQRLSELLTTYGLRLRLLALADIRMQVVSDPLTDNAETDLDPELDDGPNRILHPRLADVLSALTVVIDPLADRVEDIPLMAAAMVDARHAAGEGAADRLSRSALDALVVYPWPHNVDELDEAIRHAIRTATRSSIGAEHLPLAIRSYQVGQSPAAVEVSLDDAVRRYELKLIGDAVEATNGNRAEAARRLGISRARLLRRIDEADRK